MNLNLVLFHGWTSGASALMPVLLDAVVKGMVLLLAAGLLVLALYRASAALRQMVWLLALAALLVMPLVSAALPSWRVLPSWAQLELSPPQPSQPLPLGKGSGDLLNGTNPKDPGGSVVLSEPRLPTQFTKDDTGPMSEVPFVKAPQPSVAATAAAPSVTLPAAASPMPSRWMRVMPWLMLVWAVGIVSCLVPLVLGRLSLWRLARRSGRLEDSTWTTLIERATKAIDLRRPVTLLQSEAEPMPMVWGLWQSKLLLPAESETWPQDRRWVVLLHELAHAKRRDCLAKLIAQIACAVYWFNPLCWVAFKLMQREAEVACDDLVLAAGHKPSDYAQHLLEIASGLNSGMLASYSSIGMARKSKLEGRLLAILDPRRNRRSLTSLGVLATVVLIAGLVLPLSIIKASAAGEPLASTRVPATQPTTMPAELQGAASSVQFVGEFRQNVTVPLAAAPSNLDQSDLPQLQSIRFETCYGNSWGVIARLGFNPARDQTCGVTVDLLDERGKVLAYSRDGATIITIKADPTKGGVTQATDFPLYDMHFDGRWFPARVRVRLLPLATKPLALRQLICEVVNAQDGKPLPHAVVGVTAGNRKWLYVASAKGRCQVDVPGGAGEGGSSSVGLAAGKDGFARGFKTWDGQPVQVFQIALQPAQSLGGIVKDDQGQPIAGATVSIGMEGTSDRATQTDAKGQWRFDGVPRNVDHVSLMLNHAQFICDSGYVRKVAGASLREAQALNRVEVMSPGAAVTGRIVDAAGQGVPGAAAILCLTDPRGRFDFNYARTQADANGSFRFASIQDEGDFGPPLVSVIAEAPGYAPAIAEAEFGPQAPPVEIRLSPGRDIACRVVDPDGQPVAGAWTVILPLGQDSQDYDRWQEDSNAEGRFIVHDAPEQGVLLTVGKTGYFTLRGKEIAPAQAELTIEMRPAAHIHGTVTDEKTGKPVQAFRVSTSVGQQDLLASQGVPCADGRYDVAVAENPQAPRRVEFVAQGYRTFVSDPLALDNPDQVLDIKLTEGAGVTGPRGGSPGPWGGAAAVGDSIYLPAPIQVKGVVRDAAGKPRSGASVKVWGTGQDPALTNASGEFDLSMQPDRSPEPWGLLLLVSHKPSNQAAAVTVADAAQPVEIKLAPANTITGQVLDPGGAPIAEAHVGLMIWIGDAGCGFVAVQSDKQGRYRFESVPPWDNYDVSAQASKFGQEDLKVKSPGATGKAIAMAPITLRRADLTVSGVVVDDQGKPLPRVSVHVSGAGQPSWRETLTNRDGKFTFRNLCAGDLRLTAISGEVQVSTHAQGGQTDVKFVVTKRKPEPK